MYDYLIVGAGLSGAIFAHEANKRGKKVKLIDIVPDLFIGCMEDMSPILMDIDTLSPTIKGIFTICLLI